uniref:Actin-binding protein n=2 Tax=Saccharomyces cerevisiae TaxID=4932 RepID=UPI00017B5A75|nr:Chain A, Actin-binding protein [unidentified]
GAMAPWATAEYDYDAAEDNELTFVENDKIINIEFVDDDWWLGELEKDGSKGLFPSNYVSLGN